MSVFCLISFIKGGGGVQLTDMLPGGGGVQLTDMSPAIRCLWGVACCRVGSSTVAFLKFARSITTFNFQPCLSISADQSAVFFRIGLAQIAISVAFAPSGWLKSWVRCISETIAYSDRIMQLLWCRYKQYRLVGAEHLFTSHHDVEEKDVHLLRI